MHRAPRPPRPARASARVAVVTIAALAATSAAFAHDVDPTKLPLGDGKLSDSPKTGYIWACHTNPDGGGAQVEGPWIDRQNGTFDITAKAIVDGSVSWPHSFTMTQEGDARVIAWNALPDHPTGTYPIARSDDAFQYDRNPNSIAEHHMELALPLEPQLAASPTCAPGAVGVLLSGVVLFNALDAPGRDAVAHETQDACQGHPQQGSVYHYHNASSCVLAELDPGTGQSKLIGYAIDGFGIYGPRDENGETLSSADLDECHGITSEVDWNGERRVMYHYVATMDFPYTVGCLRGEWSRDDLRTISGPPPQGGPGMGGPRMGGPGGQGFRRPPGGGPPRGRPGFPPPMR